MIAACGEIEHAPLDAHTAHPNCPAPSFTLGGGLDALLRRCQVTGGRLADAGTADARLEVTFTPDRRLWPADLLPPEESAS